MTITCIHNVIDSNWERIKNSPRTPKNVDWRKFNPDKELVQIGKSGKVCLNRKPIKINRKWEKDTPEGCDVIYVCGMPLFRHAGMIYRYSIGEVSFDVRGMRRDCSKYLGHLQEEYKMDMDFKDPLEGLTLTAFQLDKILEKVESHWDIFGDPPPRMVEMAKLSRKRKAVFAGDDDDDDDLPF